MYLPNDIDSANHYYYGRGGGSVPSLFLSPSYERIKLERTIPDLLRYFCQQNLSGVRPVAPSSLATTNCS